MIRVERYGPDPAEPDYDEWHREDIDATSATVSPDGSLTLVKVSFREVRDNPNDLASPKRLEMSNPQLVRIIGPGRWREVWNLDLEETT